MGKSTINGIFNSYIKLPEGIFSSSHRVGPRSSVKLTSLACQLNKRAESFGQKKPIPKKRSYDQQPHSAVPNYVVPNTPRKPWFLGVFNIGKGWIPRCKLWTAFQVCYTVIPAAILDDPCLARFSGKPTNPPTHTQKEFVLFTCKIIKSYSAFKSEGVKALYFLVLQCTSSALTKLGRIWQDCNVQLPSITRCPLVIWHFAMDTMWVCLKMLG